MTRPYFPYDHNYTESEFPFNGEYIGPQNNEE